MFAFCSTFFEGVDSGRLVLVFVVSTKVFYTPYVECVGLWHLILHELLICNNAIIVQTHVKRVDEIGSIPWSQKTNNTRCASMWFSSNCILSLLFLRIYFNNAYTSCDLPACFPKEVSKVCYAKLLASSVEFQIMARSTYRWAQKGQGLIAGFIKGNQWLIDLMRPEYPHFRWGYVRGG